VYYVNQTKSEKPIKSRFLTFCWIYYLFILYTLPTSYVFKHFHRLLFFINIHKIINDTAMLYYTYKALPVRKGGAMYK
ncbi:hypothetical protein DW278_18380, partial [Clostridium botulinum]|nr:hypothetical protein [Clostridium botulinum]